MLKLLLHDPPEHFCPISLLLNYLVCAPSAVSLSAPDATRATMNIIQGKQWRRMCMHSVAFIMRWVCQRVPEQAYRSLLSDDLRRCSLMLFLSMVKVTIRLWDSSQEECAQHD